MVLDQLQHPCFGFGSKVLFKYSLPTTSPNTRLVASTRGAHGFLLSHAADRFIVKLKVTTLEAFRQYGSVRVNYLICKVIFPSVQWHAINQAGYAFDETDC